MLHADGSYFLVGVVSFFYCNFGGEVLGTKMLLTNHEGILSVLFLKNIGNLFSVNQCTGETGVFELSGQLSTWKILNYI